MQTLPIASGEGLRPRFGRVTRSDVLLADVLTELLEVRAEMAELRKQVAGMAEQPRRATGQVHRPRRIRASA